MDFLRVLGSRLVKRNFIILLDAKFFVVCTLKNLESSRNSLIVYLDLIKNGEYKYIFYLPQFLKELSLGLETVVWPLLTAEFPTDSYLYF